MVIGEPEIAAGPMGPGETYVFRFDGSNWVQEQKFTSSDGVIDDEFGTRVGVSGDILVSSAFGADGQQVDTGAVYVFRYDGSMWCEEQKIIASDGMEDDSFVNCDVDGDVIVVGAATSLSLQGSAYVYRYDGASWNEEQKLTASDGLPSDFFGSASISGDVICIGASDADGSTTGGGAAYVFRYNGTMWVQEQKLIPSDMNPTGFGGRTAVHGDVIVVSTSTPSPGAVYVFRYDGSMWCEEQILTPTADTQFARVATTGSQIAVGGEANVYVYSWDGSSWTNEQSFPMPSGEGFPSNHAVALHGSTLVAGAAGTMEQGDDTGSVFVFDIGDPTPDELVAGDSDGDDVGSSIALDAGLALIGAPSDDGVASNNGSSYVFRHDGLSWSQEQKLVPSSTDANEYFGRASAVFGDVAVIGAPCLSASCPTLTGSAYVFRYDGSTWSEEQVLTALDGMSGDLFGTAVALHGDVAVVGARSNNNRGAAYVFRYNGTMWVEEQKIVGDGCKQLHGLEVAVDGDVIALTTDAIFAFVYRYDGMTWQEEQILSASVGTLDQGSVSLDGDTVVFGNSSDGDAGSSAGAIHVFRYNGSFWLEDPKITAGDATSGDGLGASVAISGATVLGGAPGGDGTVMNSGTAYVFNLNEDICATEFIRGDPNGDGIADIADAISILMYLFQGESSDCLDALDVNDNETISISDAFHLICFLFCSPNGTAPPAPYPACGTDPTADIIDCDSLASCP